MDAVGSPALFGNLHERILTGYVLDALEWWRPAGPSNPAAGRQAEHFVEGVTGSDRIESDSVGLGNYRILRGQVLGGELVENDRVVHISAFPTDDRRSAGLC